MSGFRMCHQKSNIYTIILAVMSLVFFAGQSHAGSFVIEDFEDYARGDVWSNLSDASVADQCDLGSNQNKCLRVTYRPTSTGSAPLVRRIEIPKSNHYALTYDVFFEPGFEFVKGGKLPGLGSEDPTTGCQTARPGHWSARMMWRQEGVIRNYIYDQDRERSCGDGDESLMPIFTTGRWHTIEIVVKLNSGKQTYDGFVVAKVDGNIVTDDRNLRLRNNTLEESMISNFMFSTFFGGADRSWAPSKIVHARFDNFVARDLSDEVATKTATTTPAQKIDIKRPKAPFLQVISVDNVPAKTIKRETFDDDLGAYSNRSWKQLKPDTIWATGFSEQRAFIDNSVARSGHALRVLYPDAASGSSKSGLRWEINVPENENSIALSYHMFIQPGFEFTSGGILPGVGFKSANGNSFWKSFLAWDSEGLLRVASQTSAGYLYNLLNLQGSRPALTPGKWHFIEMFVKLNSLAADDTLVEVWLDNVKVGFLNRMPFANDVASTQINRVYFDSYTLKPVDDGASVLAGQKIWFDDMRISQSPLDLD